MSWRFDRAAIAALAAITGLYLILFGYFIGATALRVPVFDEIFWVLQYIDHWLTGDYWGYLWIDHNGHRIIWCRLLTIPMLQWPGGSVMPFILFGIVCFVVMIGGLVLEVMSAPLPPGPRIAIALMVVLLLATSFSAIDSATPMFGNFLHSCVFVVLALLLWEAPGEGNRHGTGRRIGALIAGALAAFGVSGGMLVLPVLVWIAWRGAFGWRWVLAALAVTVAVPAIYFPTQHALPLVTTFDGPTLLRMADYTVRFFGLPWSHSPALVNVGRLIGLATILAGAFIVLRYGVIGRPRNRLDRIAVGLLLFTYLIAGAITFGRLDTAPEREMPIRYALFTQLAQVGILLAASPWLCRLWMNLKRPAVQSAMLCAAVLLLVQQVLGGQAGARVVQQYTAAYRAYESGNATWAQDRLMASPRYANRALDFIHAQGLFPAEH